MFSHYSYSSASVIMCMLWTFLLQKTMADFCANIPNAPLHGKIKISGQMYLRIHCNSRDMDLPLNAPGEGGVLACAENSYGNRIASTQIIAPECLKYKRPDVLYMPIRLVYTADSCEHACLEHVQESVNSLKVTNLHSLSTICTNCWSTSVKIVCDDNKNFVQHQRPKQMDVTFKIETVYNDTLPLQHYLDLLSDIRKSSFAIDKDTEATASLWSINGTTLEQTYVGAWTASCTNVNNTSGTNLAIHHIASCRGCPVSTLFVEPIHACKPCPFDQYTRHPFADTCESCPDESLWGKEKEKMIKDCYVRPHNP